MAGIVQYHSGMAHGRAQARHGASVYYVTTDCAGTRVTGDCSPLDMRTEELAAGPERQIAYAILRNRTDRDVALSLLDQLADRVVSRVPPRASWTLGGDDLDHYIRHGVLPRAHVV